MNLESFSAGTVTFLVSNARNAPKSNSNPEIKTPTDDQEKISAQWMHIIRAVYINTSPASPACPAPDKCM